MNMYFQIQYRREDGDSVHSDGCDYEMDREFAHKLLDEWLDNWQFQKSKDNQHEDLLECAHVIFGCCNHH